MSQRLKIIGRDGSVSISADLAKQSQMMNTYVTNWNHKDTLEPVETDYKLSDINCYLDYLLGIKVTMTPKLEHVMKFFGETIIDNIHIEKEKNRTDIKQKWKLLFDQLKKKTDESRLYELFSYFKFACTHLPPNTPAEDKSGLKIFSDYIWCVSRMIGYENKVKNRGVIYDFTIYGSYAVKANNIESHLIRKEKYDRLFTIIEELSKTFEDYLKNNISKLHTVKIQVDDSDVVELDNIDSDIDNI